jgi:hypothetical protein
VIDGILTDELAARCLRWRLAPGRYLKPERGWTSRSKFRPLVDIRDAFRLLDAVADDYSLLSKPGGVFTATVRVAGRIGKAAGEPKARAISLAVARAMGMDVPDADALPATRIERVRGGNRGK